jgi:HlyD family secretion protein
VTVVDVEEG